MEKKIKGMFLKNIVQTIKQRKGPEGLTALKKELGEINYFGIKSYPVEEEVRLHKAAIKVLFGKVTTETYRELGKLSFLTYAESIIGKTMISLFQGDIKRLVLSVKLAIDTISSGFEIKVVDLGGNKAMITLLNLPYPVEYYEGVWLAAIEYFERTGAIKSGKVEARILKPGDYEYILTWE